MRKTSATGGAEGRSSAKQSRTDGQPCVHGSLNDAVQNINSILSGGPPSDAQVAYLLVESLVVKSTLSSGTSTMRPVLLNLLLRRAACKLQELADEPLGTAIYSRPSYKTIQALLPGLCAMAQTRVSRTCTLLTPAECQMVVPPLLLVGAKLSGCLVQAGGAASATDIQTVLDVEDLLLDLLVRHKDVLGHSLLGGDAAAAAAPASSLLGLLRSSEAAECAYALTVFSRLALTLKKYSAEVLVSELGASTMTALVETEAPSILYPNDAACDAELALLSARGLTTLHAASTTYALLLTELGVVLRPGNCTVEVPYKCLYRQAQETIGVLGQLTGLAIANDAAAQQVGARDPAPDPANAPIPAPPGIPQGATADVAAAHDEGQDTRVMLQVRGAHAHSCLQGTGQRSMAFARQLNEIYKTADKSLKSQLNETAKDVCMSAAGQLSPLLKLKSVLEDAHISDDVLETVVTALEKQQPLLEASVGALEKLLKDKSRLDAAQLDRAADLARVLCGTVAVCEQAVTQAAKWANEAWGRILLGVIGLKQFADGVHSTGEGKLLAGLHLGYFTRDSRSSNHDEHEARRMNPTVGDPASTAERVHWKRVFDDIMQRGGQDIVNKMSTELGVKLQAEGKRLIDEALARGEVWDETKARNLAQHDLNFSQMYVHLALAPVLHRIQNGGAPYDTVGKKLLAEGPILCECLLRSGIFDASMPAAAASMREMGRTMDSISAAFSPKQGAMRINTATVLGSDPLLGMAATLHRMLVGVRSPPRGEELRTTWLEAVEDYFLPCVRVMVAALDGCGLLIKASEQPFFSVCVLLGKVEEALAELRVADYQLCRLCITQGTPLDPVQQRCYDQGARREKERLVDARAFTVLKAVQEKRKNKNNSALDPNLLAQRYPGNFSKMLKAARNIYQHSVDGNSDVQGAVRAMAAVAAGADTPLFTGK